MLIHTEIRTVEYERVVMMNYPHGKNVVAGLIAFTLVFIGLQAAAIAARVTGSRRNALYQRILTLGNRS